MSFSESADAREENVSESTGMQSCNQYSRGEFPLNPCVWEHFLEMKQDVKDQYNLMSGNLISCVGMAEDDDQSGLFSALFTRENRFWIGDNHAQARATSFSKMHSKREPASDAAERVAVRGGTEWEPSSPSASERAGQAEGARQTGSERTGKDLPHDKV